MPIKVYLTESQLKKILNEELGIARKVLDLTKIIARMVLDCYHNRVFNKHFKVSIGDKSLQVHFLHKVFDNKEGLRTFINQGGLKNGYSKNENTLFLTSASIKGKKINEMDVLDTIQHEVEHWWQTTNAEKPLYNTEYDFVQTHIKSSNWALSTICEVNYFTKHFEIDAYVNGAYSVLNKEGIKTCDEFIYKTNIKELILKYDELRYRISAITYESAEYQEAVRIVNINQVKIKTDKKQMLKLLNDGEKYLKNKVGKAWTHYIAMNTSNNVDENVYTDPLLKTINPSWSREQKLLGKTLDVI